LSRLLDALGEVMALLLEVIHFLLRQDFVLFAVEQSSFDQQMDLDWVVDVEKR